MPVANAPGSDIDLRSEVRQFHLRVDQAAARLAEKHSERLQCKRGCSGCCVDGITVFEIEAENIRSNHTDLLENAEPHPNGACAFLDSVGACRIYKDRPYVCRTQGLPLRWIDEDEAAEFRDICPLNESRPPVEELASEDCWTIGPFEGELARIQSATGTMARVALRELFAKKAAER